MIKKRLKSVALVIGISVLLGIGLIIVFAIYDIVFSKTNASDVEWSYSINLNITENIENIADTLQNTKEVVDELNWYTSVEAAVEDDTLFEYKEYKPYVLQEEFLRIHKNNKLIIFHFVPNGYNEKQILISYIIFACKEGNISQPYERGLMVPDPGWGAKNLYYDCDDAVVDYIIFELRSNEVLSDEKLQMFFGTWPDKDELESLTLSGIPLEILEEPLELNGSEYYFWYLTDLSWCEKLQEIHWSKFTYADVIELLDIQYTPTETR